MKAGIRRLWQPWAFLWLANGMLALPWVAIALLVLVGRLNQQPDPMPVLLVLAMLMGIGTIVLGLVTIGLGLGLGVVAIVWATRAKRLGQMRGAIGVWMLLLASWTWFVLR